MIEDLLAWVLLIQGVLTGEPAWYIGSAIFAVAVQISRVVDCMDRRKPNEE